MSVRQMRPRPPRPLKEVADTLARSRSIVPLKKSLTRQDLYCPKITAFTYGDMKVPFEISCKRKCLLILSRQPAIIQICTRTFFVYVITTFAGSFQIALIISIHNLSFFHGQLSRLKEVSPPDNYGIFCSGNLIRADGKIPMPRTHAIERGPPS